MKKPQGCLKNFSLGRFQGESDCPEGRSPKDSLITRGTIHGNFFPDKPKAFPLFVILWGLKTDAAEGLPEENPEGGFRLSLGTV